METYYFHIRDEFGVIEDADGMELSDRLALLVEVIRSADEFLQEAKKFSKMWFEVTDREGRLILMTPVQHSAEIWRSLDALSLASGSMH